MAIEVKIPPLGESITTGIIATWHVQDGDFVKEGQPLFDLETDKITQEATAETGGTIQIQAEEGDEVEIGAVVALIDDSAREPSEGAADSRPQEPAPESTGKDAAGNSGQTPPTEKQSPAVERIAAETGIDPSTLRGTGKEGRVTKGDMLKAAQARPTSKQEETPTDPAPSSEKPGSAEKPGSRRKMTPLRRTIARRLVEAQQSTAMLTTFNEVNMGPVMQLRKTHQEAFVKKHGVKLGFMSFFTKAVVHALKSVPAVNGRIDGDMIVENHYYDIGIAVSTPKGLMVPVVRGCDSKSFAEIENSIITYANRAKEGKITMEDLEGGVFSITNGGIFGSMLSTPILNFPQSAILGMHTIQERPVAENGQVVIRPMMYLALSYDHRLVDGKEAVSFLVTIKKAIEDPTRLLFEI